MALFGDLGAAVSSFADAIAKPFVSTAIGGPSSGVRALGKNVPTRYETTGEGTQMADLSYGPQGFNRGINPTIQPQSQSFFGNLGSTLGGFGRDVGTFVSDIAPLTSLFGIGDNLQRTNAGTATTIINQRPDETSASGEYLGANLGMGANLLTQAGRFLSRPSTQIGTGLGLGALSLMDSGNGQGNPRITRRMKSDVRRIYMMAGMNADVTAQILNNMGTYPKMNFNASLVFFILTKRFRNDGPVVTKAAVRKTKSTLRRMKGVVDMYNSVCKPTTRRAPARRAAPKAVQLIKN
jgi:hypothetical protein